MFGLRRDAAAGRLRRVDAALPPGHGRRRPSWRRSARSRRWRCCRWRSRNGDVFGLSGTGWTYMLILTFTSGVAAQGLLVFAQKTIQIGTIGDRPGRAAGARGRVVVPAARRGRQRPAGRRHRDRRWSGCSAFVVLNQRGDRRAQAVCLTARASVRSRSVMKCEAAAMRRSAASAELARRGVVAGVGREPGERVEGEDLDGRVAVARGPSSRIAPSRASASGAPSSASSAASRHSPSAACSPPPASRCHAAAASSAARAARVAAERAQHAAEVHARERRQAHVAGGLGLLDRELERGGAGRRSRRPGTAPGRGSTTW